MQNAILMFSSSPDYKQACPIHIKSIWTHNAGPTHETVRLTSTLLTETKKTAIPFACAKLANTLQGQHDHWVAP